MKYKLPKKSRDYIKNKARSIKTKVRENQNFPIALYRHTKNYGFEERILSGNYSPFPEFDQFYHHCFTDAVERFFIAKELGLDPRFYLMYGMRDKKDSSEKRSDLEERIENRNRGRQQNGFDHAVVTVAVKGRKLRFLIDPLLSNAGYMRWNHQAREISLQRGKFERNKLEYDYILELDEKELFDKIHHMQSEGGAVQMLECGQRIKDFGVAKHNHYLFVRYDTEKNALESQVTMPMPVILNRGMVNHISLDDLAEVKRQGVEFFFYEKQDWMTLQNKTDMGTFGLEKLKGYWNILEKAFSDKFKSPSSSLRKKHYLEIIDGLRDQNIENILNPVQLQDAQERIGEHPLSVRDLDGLSGLSDAVIKNFEELKENDSFTKTLIQIYNQNRLFQEKRNNKKIPEQDYGFFYTEEQRFRFLRDLLKKRTGFVEEVNLLEGLVEELVDGIDIPIDNLGPVSEVRKRYEAAYEKFDKADEEYKDYKTLLSISKKLFNLVTDWAIFLREYGKEIAALSPKPDENLRSFVEEHSDGLLTEYSMILEEMFIRAYQTRSTLQLRGYFPRIQEKIKAYLKDN